MARPRALSPPELARALELHDTGLGFTQIAVALGRNYRNVYTAIRRVRPAPDQRTGIDRRTTPPTPDPRAPEMAEQRRQGETLAQIGVRHGLTRERVRQVLIANGHPDTALDRRTADRERRSRDLVEVARVAAQALDRSPGMTRGQLAGATGLTPDQIAGALRDTALRRKVSHTQPADTGMPAAEALDGVRVTAVTVTAATGQARLSAPAYDTHRDPRTTLSSPRLVQLHGTWTAACQAAGVVPVTPNRTYQQHWTTADINTALINYFTDPGTTGTYIDFERWARARPGTPSAQTIRNDFGSWTAIKTLGLRLAHEHITRLAAAAAADLTAAKAGLAGGGGPTGT